jgi:hypothetical protein
MNTDGRNGEAQEPEQRSGFSTHPESETAPAWEMIEPGRYKPRRIRGSFLGGELG